MVVAATIRHTMPPDTTDLRDALATLVDHELPEDPIERAQHRALTAALLREAFRRNGMESALVGGGAIEFHAPGVYATDDIDIVVASDREAVNRDAISQVFAALGFAKRGRHWERGTAFVEVPSHVLNDPVEEHEVGNYRLLVVKPEVVLADRVVGFKHWSYTAHGAQAVTLIAALGNDLDDAWLAARLEREDAMDAYTALRALAESERAVNDEVLRELRESLNV